MNDEDETALLAALNSARLTLEHVGKSALEASAAFRDFIIAYEENELITDSDDEEEETDDDE